MADEADAARAAADFREPLGVPALPLWEVIRTAHVVERAFRAVFAEADLTPQQFGILASLADEPGCSRADLARNVMVRPQSLTRLLDGMLDGGLLAQDGPRGRGRRARLTITEEGLRRLQRAWPLVVAVNSPGRTGLTDDQAARLSRLLVELRDHLDGH